MLGRELLEPLVPAPDGEMTVSGPRRVDAEPPDDDVFDPVRADGDADADLCSRGDGDDDAHVHGNGDGSDDGAFRDAAFGDGNGACAHARG